MSDDRWNRKGMWLELAPTAMGAGFTVLVVVLCALYALLLFGSR